MRAEETDSATQAAVPADAKVALKEEAFKAAREKDYKKTVEIWKGLRDSDPGDWTSRPWLICNYEALGDTVSRDREIAALYALRKAGSIPELNQADRFVRDTFEVEGMTAYVFEFFELKGKYAPIWKIRFRKDGEDVPYLFILESDEADTQSARALHEIGPDERVYTLDRYEKNDNQALCGAFKTKPDYADLKKLVTQELKKALAPAASPGADKK